LPASFELSSAQWQRLNLSAAMKYRARQELEQREEWHGGTVTKDGDARRYMNRQIRHP
jgi:hypothetical protein